MEENNVLTDTEELKILSDLVAIKSVNDNEILVAKYLQKLLGERNDKLSHRKKQKFIEFSRSKCYNLY